MTVLLAAAVLWSVTATAPYYELLPGQAQEVSQLITVPKSAAHPLHGQVLLTDVEVDTMKYLQFVPAYFDSDATVVPTGELTGNLPVSEFNAEGNVDMEESQQTAAAVALRQLGYAVPERDVGTTVYVVDPGSPAWDQHAGGLLPEEITAVIEYLRADAPAADTLPALTLAGDSARGLSMFLRNCAGCHGMDGRGGIAPEIGNPVFQKAATDEFIVRTVRSGRQGTAMPAFQRPDAPALSDQDIADVLACVRTFGQHKREKTLAQNAIPAPGAKP